MPSQNSQLYVPKINPPRLLFTAEIEDEIDLHLVGGYADEAGKAARLSRRFLRFFADSASRFALHTLCVGQPNSKTGHYCHNEPKVGGVVVGVADGLPAPAVFNRAFVSGKADEETMFTLLLGPSLIKKPFKLKKIILEKEDQGYGIRSAA